MLGSAIGAGIGILGGIGGLFAAKKNNRELSKLMKQNPTYQANPIAAERLAFAKTLLNARTPGAAQAEKNIFSAQGSQMGNIAANATDASQALALGASAQGQTNQSLLGLQQAEAQDYQRRFSNVVGAQEAQINEGDKVYQDKIRNFNDMVQMRGAQAANRSNAWNSISQGGFAAMNFGLAGGWGNIMQGVNKNKSQAFGNRGYASLDSPSAALGNPVIGGQFAPSTISINNGINPLADTQQKWGSILNG